MILTFCSDKGGVGKSTVGTLLALALELTGRSVGFLDLNNKTMTKCMALLNKKGLSSIQPTIDTGSVDFLVVDTAGELNDETRQAIEIADRAFLVTSPSPADLWGAQETLSFIKKHKKKRVKLKLLFNSVVARSCLARDLDQQAKIIGADYLRQSIPRTLELQYMLVYGINALSASNRRDAVRLALEIVKN